MPIDRTRMYQLPWSPTDNPGGWVEVTDACDLSCPGCYRHQLLGHVPLAQIEADVLTVKRLTNCDRIAIAGGEPLLYPRILEVVNFIARQGLKPLLLTHGERLTLELAREFRKAGLVRFQFHVDSLMQRHGWSGKNEAEMNELRQHFADLVWEAGGMQCAFSITVVPASLPHLPHVLEWCRSNLHKVQHVSLIAFRSLPVGGEYEYQVNGQRVDAGAFHHSTPDARENTVTADEMYEVLQLHDRRFRAAVFMPGTTAPETTKFLVALHLGSASGPDGYLGARAVEAVQIAHHFWTGRYLDFPRDARAGKKTFLLAAVDGEVRRALRRFAGAALRRPRRLVEPTYVQTIALQQPAEVLDGKANLCSGCPNMMAWQGELVPSCRLDEYRLFGGPLVPVKRAAVGVRAELG